MCHRYSDVRHVVKILTKLQTGSVDAKPLQRQPLSALACDVEVSVSEIFYSGGYGVVP